MYLVLFISCAFTIAFSVSDGVKTSIDLTYRKGFEAYSGERWSECIAQFEDTLHLYKLRKSIMTNCRFNCALQNNDPIVQVDIENLKQYEKYFNIKNCINLCQNKGLDEVQLDNNINKQILNNIKDQMPYQYLHVCYFQMYALPKAASAAYTYLVAHPDDQDMKKNVKYYLDQPEVDINEVVDLESEDFEVLHNLGTKSYLLKNYGETIAAMEEALYDYISWENKCRIDCETMVDSGWSNDFILAMSNNIAGLLQCYQQCQDKLKVMKYNSGVEFLADVLNYLQISYYNLDKFDEAAKAVASYLVLLPHDEDMVENKKIYSSLAKENAFTERSDIVYYFKRDLYENKLLHLFHEESDNDNFSNSIE